MNYLYIRHVAIAERKRENKLDLRESVYNAQIGNSRNAAEYLGRFNRKSNFLVVRDFHAGLPRGGERWPSGRKS